MMNVKNLELGLKEFEKMKEEVWEKEKQLKNQLIELEKETFNGLTYNEYINSIKKDIRVDENIDIKLDRWNIYGEYKLKDIIIKLSATIYYAAQLYSVTIKYPNREVKDEPKKYSKEIQKLKEKCFEYKIKNPSEEYKEKYKISY